jgi:hypothetical protein
MYDALDFMVAMLVSKRSGCRRLLVGIYVRCNREAARGGDSLALE